MKNDGESGQLHGRLEEAIRLVCAAEEELDAAVAELHPVLVGDKKIASEGLQQAFEKLRGARALVDQLRSLLAALEPTAAKR